MRYYLDTEFIEQPGTIDLISIGIVSEDGREFYAENRDVAWPLASPWVLENVKPHLEGSRAQATMGEIAKCVLRFAPPDDKPEFWGYYADYDWVAFCWLFGAMVDLPKGYPMYCRDIKQWCDVLGNPRLPEQKSTEHNALCDARWNKAAWEFLNGATEEIQSRLRLTGDCLVRLEQENERQENLLRRCRDTMNSFGWRHDKTETAELLDVIDRELRGDATDG